jgi:hypothetical protein
VARKEGILQQGVPEDSFLQFGFYYVDSTRFPGDAQTSRYSQGRRDILKILLFLKL